MTEERFNKFESQLDHIARTLTELIRIVGNTNAAIEELRSEVNGVKNDVNGLKHDVNELKQDVNGLKQDVNELKISNQQIKEEIREIKMTLKEHGEKLDYALLKLLNHDVKLHNLKIVQP